jgi:2-polyprenyl-3-methyl-5-hydroxy-6-metoxy-1,4-benzoquinol methylase
MNLTNNKFWDSYWKKVKLPSEVDMNFSFDRCLASELKRNSNNFSGEVFEIGCAPGKWLAYFYKEFGLSPNGIEYSKAGMNATYKNLTKLGIKSSIIYGDFFSTKCNKKFDVVMSLGFIEHFDDPEIVIKRHLKWLKPNGILILGIPNFSNINGSIQNLLNKEILKKHNLNIMNLEFFNSLAQKFNLDKIFIDYIGSFEPCLVIPEKRISNLRQISIRIILLFFKIIRKSPVFDNFNNKFISSYILAIYKKQ